MAETTDVRGFALFAGLPEDQLAQISLHVHRTTVPAGTFLASAQLPSDVVYFILQGSVKHQLITEDGTELTLALFGPGDTIGETTLVSRRGASTSVITREETSLLWMDRKDFMHSLDLSQALNRNLVRQLSDRLRRANEHIQSLATLDVTGRVARQILDLAQQYGKARPGEGVHIPLPVTQGEIAEMVAATRERVNHVMVRLRRLGVFSIDAEHRITVHQPEVLGKLCRF